MLSDQNLSSQPSLDNEALWNPSGSSSMPDPEERYSAQRADGFDDLRFRSDLEAEFRQHYQLRNKHRIRVANLSALVAMAMFLLVDKFIGGRLQPWVGDLIISAVLIPLLLVGVWMAGVRAVWRYRQWLVFANVLAIGVALCGLIAYGRAGNAAFPYEPMLLLMVYVYFLGGLIFGQALLCSALIWGLFVLLNQELAAPGRAVYEAYYVGVMACVCALGLYFSERQHRYAFLLENELRHQAVTDSLTKLMNRGAFRRHLDRIWQMAQRDKKTIGLMLIDLDHFKSINDEHGHLAGDEVLVTLGQALREQLKRPLDAAGRFGGDEFVGVWYDVDADWFQRLPEVFQARLAGARFPRARNKIQPTTSVGAVLVPAGALDKPLTAMRRADELLYQVKEAGRDGFRVAIVEPQAADS